MNKFDDDQPPPEIDRIAVRARARQLVCEQRRRRWQGTLVVVIAVSIGVVSLRWPASDEQDAMLAGSAPQQTQANRQPAPTMQASVPRPNLQPPFIPLEDGRPGYSQNGEVCVPTVFTEQDVTPPPIPGLSVMTRAPMATGRPGANVRVQVVLQNSSPEAVTLRVAAPPRVYLLNGEQPVAVFPTLFLFREPKKIKIPAQESVALDSFLGTVNCSDGPGLASPAVAAGDYQILTVLDVLGTGPAVGGAEEPYTWARITGRVRVAA